MNIIIELKIIRDSENRKTVDTRFYISAANKIVSFFKNKQLTLF